MAVELVKVVALACLITFCVSTPTLGIVPTPETEQESPKYEYSYVVKDDYGGSQGHVQTRKGEYATGKYYVHVPGGIDQKVDYFADDWGYHPLVEYKSLSRSGSSSTQFALGEKAVAALTKSQARVEPEKLVRASVSSPRPKPSVLIHSSTGIISNPRAQEEQVESSSALPTPTPLVSFKSTSGVVSNPTESYEDSENNIRTSTVESVKVTASARYVNRYAPKTQTSSSIELVDSEVNSAPSEDISIVNFESKKHSPYQEATKHITENEDYLGNSFSSSTTDSIDSDSANDFATEQSYQKNELIAPLNTSEKSEESIEITSYLADPNSAIDVITNNSTDVPKKTEVDSSNEHTISAIFFAESDQKQENNEIQSESSHISSTVGPEISLSEFSFGPIIVPDYPRNKELFEFFHNASSKGEEKQELPSFNIEHEAISATGEDNELKTTPRPLRKVVSKSDSEASDKKAVTSSVASSNELLAPIQAGVSLSSHKAQVANQATRDESFATDDEPEIEKQVIQKEAVYKTTVDIQKSIPLEITTQNVNVDQQVASHGNRDDYNNLEQQKPAGIDFNELPQSDPPHVELNNIVTSQQRLSSHNDLQPNVNNVHVNPLQNIPTPTYVPGNLYYIYLQRYNPFTNRYSIVPQPVVLQPYPFSINAINNLNNQLYQSVSQLQPETYSLIPHGSKLNILDTDVQHSVLPTVEQNVDSPHDPAKNPDTEPLGEFQKADGNSETSFLQTDDSEGSNLDTKPTEPSDPRSNHYQHLTQVDDEGTPHSAQTLASTYAAQLNALTAARYNEIHSSDSQISEIKIDTTQETKQIVPNGNVNSDSVKAREYFKEFSGIEPNGEINTAFKNIELYGGPDQVTENSKILSRENVVRTEPLPSEEPKVLINKPFQDPIYVGIEPNVPEEPKVLINKPFQDPIYVGIEPNMPRAQSFIPGPIHSGKPDAFRQLYPSLLPASLARAVKHPKQLLMAPHHTHIATITIKHHQPHTAKQRRAHQIPIEKSHQPPFIPSQKVFSSIYPPETYYVTQYMTRQDRSGGKSSRQLLVEYGGFKPPMVPSVQIDVDPTTSTNDQAFESRLT